MDSLWTWTEALILELQKLRYCGFLIFNDCIKTKKQKKGWKVFSTTSELHQQKHKHKLISAS